jgi:Icc-related predicted phosphoesterase
MKINIMSDLHLEFGSMKVENKEGGDVLILSGDIGLGHKIEEYEYFFKECSEQWKNVIYVPGNHEFYHGDIDETDDKIRDYIESNYDNIAYLNMDTIDIDEVKFIGTVLWTSMNDDDFFVKEIIERKMNDFLIIKNKKAKNRFLPNDSVTSFKMSLDFIEREYENSKDNHKIVVCTHHAPSMQSIHQKYRREMIMNYAYASNLESFIIERSKIVLWTHGHVHDNFDYNVGNTRVVCNPRGYHGREVNKTFDKNLMLEI